MAAGERRADGEPTPLEQHAGGHALELEHEPVQLRDVLQGKHTVMLFVRNGA